MQCEQGGAGVGDLVLAEQGNIKVSLIGLAGFESLAGERLGLRDYVQVFVQRIKFGVLFIADIGKKF